jgi:hypothetical protein
MLNLKKRYSACLPVYRIIRKSSKSLLTLKLQILNSPLLALIKYIKKYSLGPLLTLPFYDIWRKDEVFDETYNEQETRDKWFMGYGLGVTICRII